MTFFQYLRAAKTVIIVVFWALILRAFLVGPPSALDSDQDDYATASFGP